MRASIANAEATEDHILYLRLDNGNALSLDVKQLFEYPLFAPLRDLEVWKTMQVHEHSLTWGEGSNLVELSSDTILDYFA